MDNQLEIWKGEFGVSYTDRNRVDYRLRLPAFRRILEDLSISQVLEVGCNLGHNLMALSELLKECDLVGVEPNRYALEQARLSVPKAGLLHGDAFDLPFKDGVFDLVFTSGVLIHISQRNLPAALSEIYRVSRRYILAIEYFAEEETMIPYRGYTNLLWKRDFLKHFQSQFPDLRLIRSGHLGLEDGFDRTHYWLLEKI